MRSTSGTLIKKKKEDYLLLTVLLLLDIHTPEIRGLDLGGENDSSRQGFFFKVRRMYE